MLKIVIKSTVTSSHTPTTHQLDTCGLLCPEPVMLLHNKIRDIPIDDMIEMMATDPSTERDIPKFCHFLGHELIQKKQEDKKYYYLIRKQSKK